jgi:LuxR family transcriptional regulator, quorum-sensing system regulator CviR
MADTDDFGARIRKSLTKREMTELIELSRRAVSVRTEPELKALEPAVQRLLDYRFMMCGLGEKSIFMKDNEFTCINVSYPAEYLSYYAKSGLMFRDSLVIAAINATGIHIFDDLIHDKSWYRGKAYSFSRSFGINEGFISVAHNYFSGTTSIFFFTAPRMPCDERAKTVLEALCPHFHEALRRICGGARPSPENPLSDREREILQWIKEGKSSWTISLILSISEATVKFHVGNILRKLDASTRAQAVASAMARGYIGPGGVEARGYPKG